MNLSRRNAPKGWLTAVALSSLALTGCGQKPADHMESAVAKPASSSAAAEMTDDALPDGGKKSADPATSGKKASPSARADKTGTRTDADRKSADPAPSSAPARKTATPTDSKGTVATAGTVPFAGTEQFVTINRAWISNGRTWLSVRPAQKKINTQFDTWEIMPSTGSFTTVPMAKNGQVLLAAPVRGEAAGTSRAELLPYSPVQLVTLINQLDPMLYSGIGYDLVFDGAGQVTSLTSLYRP
ncbi:hypothetical protein [Streptomyces sp. NBC_01716]|uniref:hypothetical protein n=1 Tax=Streptomyces sp. NBC_01716 TaxID=2975917 RepID=UPI002E32B2D5|nr:hypothetical protein [Streptomyces sp. NBC_01716]